MGEKFQVIPTTGALYAEVNEETVSLSQDDITGNGDNLGVDIPRVMFAHVLGYIMMDLDIDELKQIVDIAEGHARLKAKA